MTDITQEILTRFDALSAKLSATAPVAYNKMIDLMFAKSIVEAVQLCIAVLICIGGWKIATKVSKMLIKAEEEDEGPFTEFFGVSLFVGSIVLALFTVATIISILSATNTAIGLINPEARLLLETWEAFTKKD